MRGCFPAVLSLSLDLLVCFSSLSSATQDLDADVSGRFFTRATSLPCLSLVCALL